MTEVTPDVMRAVGMIADHLESRAGSIADIVLESARREIPEYQSLADEEAATFRGGAAFGIANLARIVRDGRGTFEETERRALAAVAEQISHRPVPLHAVIRSYNIIARELLAAVIDVLPELGSHAGPALAVTYRLGTSLIALTIELVEVAYAEKSTSDRWRDEQMQALVADLALGAIPQTYERRANAAGIPLGGWYRAIVALIGKPSTPPRWSAAVNTWLHHSLPEGCAFGHLGPIGIVVASSLERDDEAADVIDAIEREVSARSDEPITIAVGPPRDDLTRIHESYAEALAIAEAARANGRTGRVRATQMIVPRIVAAATADGIDLIEILIPLVGADDAADLIEAVRAYVSTGCSVTESADALFMHRNTLRRRIDRAEELLGFQIPDKWAEVELGLVALDLRRS